MKISAELLNKLRGVRDARNAAAVLPDAMSPEQVATVKKRIWQEIRRVYNLPTNVKFKIELDGELAGELRYKDTGRPYVPPAAAMTAIPAVTGAGAQASSGTKYVVIDDDDERVLNSFDDLIDWLRDNYGVRVVAV